MRVLVIGGAGYIGSHVVKALLEADDSVTVYDDLSTGHKINLFAQADFIEGSILDYGRLEQIMRQGFDAVVHLAAKKAVGESMENPELYAENNLTGMINILNAMSKSGCKVLVFSSSAAVYGMPEYLPVDENHPLNPINFYGFTKLESERLMAWYDRLKGIKYTALRYFNAAGYDPDGAVRGRDSKPQNLLPVVREVVEGQRECLLVFGSDYDTRDGTCVRDYVHVSDLAAAHVLAIRRLQEGRSSAVYNLGTSNGVTVKEVIAAAEKVAGKSLPVHYVARRPGDPAVLVASSKKAETELGWKPRYVRIEDIVKTEL